MARSRSGRRATAVLAACAAVALAGMAPAQATILVSTSDALPLLGDPYSIPGGACFPNVSVCVTSGAFTLTKLTGPGFVQSGSTELITTDATATINLGVAGTVTLDGTIVQEVLGRPNRFDYGPSSGSPWTVVLTSVSLTGTLDGHTLTMALNPADTSSGLTSITQDGGFFSVSSFFDVFAELTYNAPGGTLHATPSGTATASSVPEPATLALVAGPLLVMSAVRRRRR